MIISWQGFTDFVQQGVAAIQAAATSVIDASVGSVTLAYQQAIAGTALWLQARIIAAANLTRFATSFGPDADSWGAQFTYGRLPGIAASDVATFSRFTPTNQAVIAVGALIQTGPGGIQFAVGSDPTNSAYSPTAAGGSPGYVVPANTASITLPIACTQVGTVGNILQNTLTSFVQNIVGIDTVTNPNTIVNGLNAETDPAYKARFPSFVASWREATVAAIQYAVTSLQVGVSCAITEGYTLLGASDPGFFYAIVDDGSGTPPSSLVSAAATAIDDARACGVQFAVYAPTVLTVNISMSVISIDNTQHAADTAAANAALQTYIASLPDNAGLPYTRLEQIAYAASPNIDNVVDVLLNGATSDIAGVPGQVIKPGTITVS